MSVDAKYTLLPPVMAFPGRRAMAALSLRYPAAGGILPTGYTCVGVALQAQASHAKVLGCVPIAVNLIGNLCFL